MKGIYPDYSQDFSNCPGKIFQILFNRPIYFVFSLKKPDILK